MEFRSSARASSRVGVQPTSTVYRVCDRFQWILGQNSDKRRMTAVTVAPDGRAEIPRMHPKTVARKWGDDPPQRHRSSGALPTTNDTRSASGSLTPANRSGPRLRDIRRWASRDSGAGPAVRLVRQLISHAARASEARYRRDLNTAPTSLVLRGSMDTPSALAGSAADRYESSVSPDAVVLWGPSGVGRQRARVWGEAPREPPQLRLHADIHGVRRADRAG